MEWIFEMILNCTSFVILQFEWKSFTDLKINNFGDDFYSVQLRQRTTYTLTAPSAFHNWF